METIRFIKKIIFVFLFWFVFLPQIWSEDATDNSDTSLEAILQKNNVTVDLYMLPFSMSTRGPVSEELMRVWYTSKMTQRSTAIFRDLILKADKLPKDRKLNVRLLFDIIVENEVVYTVPISIDDGLHEDILKTFDIYLGISFWLKYDGNL